MAYKFKAIESDKKLDCSKKVEIACRKFGSSSLDDSNEIAGKNDGANEIKLSLQEILDKKIKKWTDAVGELNFNDQEFDELVNYAKYIISKRNS